MLPPSLSASAIQAYEACPAQFKAIYIDKIPRIDGEAASLGTACHEALEMYVKGGHHNPPDLKALMKFYDEAYWKVFKDASRFDEGKEILEGWWARTDLLDGRKILSTEVKQTFPIKTASGAEVPFNYIWDRCDELPDGGIEVVDYKTLIMPISHEDLRKKIQARLYGLAAQIQFPKAPVIWVTFDLLRHDSVGIKLTRENNIETYRYLQAVTERIIADDYQEEKLNPDCRFCVRNSTCPTLGSHVKGGGPLRFSTPEAAIDQRARLEYASKALTQQVKDLDEYLLEWAERENLLEYQTEETSFNIAVQNRRSIPTENIERAAKLLGPAIMARYGSLTMRSVDAILKGENLDADVKQELKRLIKRNPTAPSVKTKPLAALGEED